MEHRVARVIRSLAACAALAVVVVGIGPPVRAQDEPPAPEPRDNPAELQPSLADRYRETANRILVAARADGRAYERLEYLCDRIGHRLSGSAALEKAIDWAVATMKADGLDNVRKEPVLVRAWRRGAESAVMTEPREFPLAMLGLGNSVGTPPGGITAEVVVVADFDELEALGDEVAGKIVLYDRPMPAYDPVKGSGYGATVAYRTRGPSRAAEQGAVAVLVRSVTATSLRTPHTGMLAYTDLDKAIPAAAVSVEDAQMMSRLAARGVTVKVRLKMEAQILPDAPSFNVVGEITGSEKPDEIVVIGGHLDSWDVGQGAHDDGGPSMACMDALRLLKSLGLRPRRTLRVVLFTNEENGLRGGLLYAENHKKEMRGHVAAIEADSGAFRPLGFSTPKATDPRGERMRARLEDIARLLDPIGAGRIVDGGGGADIAPMKAYGVPQIGLRVEGSTYFDVHHTHADTFDKVDREEIHLCEAAMAVMAYVIADMPQRLNE